VVKIEPDADLLEIITRGSAHGITIQDASGHLIYANDAAARMCDFGSGDEMRRAPAEAIVERFEILDEDGLPLPPEDLPGRRAARGERDPEAIVRFRSRSGGDDRWSLVRARPIFDDHGRLLHVVNVFADVTADHSSREARSFLADATRELPRSLDREGMLQRVARLAVPRMADWCAVDLLEPDGSLALVASAHIDPAKAEWARGSRRRSPLEVGDGSGVARAVRTGSSRLIPDVTDGSLDLGSFGEPELGEDAEHIRPRSVMYLPLIARGRTMGAITMVRSDPGRRYTEDDLRLAEDLATRMAFALDNARLYEERDHVARSLQQRLLPKSLPQIPGIDVAAHYFAAGDVLLAGGDFYDLFEMDDGSWKAVIGDVCGKGPGAAALMGFVRFTTRAVSRQDTKPSEALVKLNRALLEELDAGQGEFCTAAVVRVRPHDRGARLTVAVAGHPLPIILRANGDVEEAGAPGTLLGIFEDIDVSDEVVDLHMGDTLVMLTDGVLEAGRDRRWDSHVIPELLRSSIGLPPEEIADRIEAAVADVDDRRIDDVAILVMRCRADPF
jgi:serine phosphatase RsbU (regulator of sigma subunit)